MNRFFLWLTGCLLLTFSALAQTPNTARPDSVPATTTSADDLLSGLTDSTEAAPLLPRHMIFTQRAFWGPKGLLRVMNAAPLTPEGRTKELKIRRGMLRTHQIMGFVTLAGFVAQGIVGSQLYKAEGADYTRIKKTHESLARGINIAYTTTALLSLTAPPKAVDERRGFSSIKLHKYLSVLHIAGMIATNVIAHQITRQIDPTDPTLRDYKNFKGYHRAAAFTTFGAFAASIIAIKF